MEDEEVGLSSFLHSTQTNTSSSHIQGPSFWNFMYLLRQSGTLCDAQLCVKQDQTTVSFPVHKVVIAGSSRYFSNCLYNNDLLDVYNFDGLSIDNLQSVIDYMYRQISWSQLTSDPLGAVVAQTLELIYHGETPNNSAQFPRDVNKKFIKPDHESERIYINPGDIKQVIEDTRQAMPRKQSGKKKTAEVLPKVELDNNEPHDEAVSEIDVVYETEMKYTNDDDQDCANSESEEIEKRLIVEDLDITDMSKTNDNDKNFIMLHEIKKQCKQKLIRNSNEDTCTSENVETPKKRMKLITEEITTSSIINDKTETVNELNCNKLNESISENLTHLNVENVKFQRESNEAVLHNIDTKTKISSSDDAESEVKTKVIGDSSQSKKQILVYKDNSDKFGDISAICSQKIGKSVDSLGNDTEMLIVKQECTSVNNEVTTEQELATISNSEETKNVLHLELIHESTQNDTKGNILPNGQCAETNNSEQDNEKDQNIVQPVLILLSDADGKSEPDKGKMKMSKIEETLGLSTSCKECNKNLVKREELCLHMLLMHQKYLCNACDFETRTESSLGLHRNEKHNFVEVYDCHQCDTQFKLKKHYMKHMRIAHGCKPYECQFCDAKYVSCEGLRHHMQTTHTSDQPQYMCELCGKSYKTKSQLHHHLTITHKEEPDIPCKLCDRKFKQFSSFKRHLKTFHCDERNYKCEVCQRLFKTKDDKNKHMRRHFMSNRRIDQFGNKIVKHPVDVDYPCPHCDKVFQSYPLMKAHENIQHIEKSNGISYICSMCEKPFSTRHYLNMHINNTHKPKDIECPGCSLKFHYKFELKRHRPRCKGYPTAPKPFRCVYCDKSFTLKGNLTKHAQLNRCKALNEGKPPNTKVDSSDIVVLIQDGSHVEQVMGKVEIPLEQLQELGIESTDNIYEGGIEGARYEYVNPQSNAQKAANPQVTTEIELHEYILETGNEKAKVEHDRQFSDHVNETDYTTGRSCVTSQSNVISTSYKKDEVGNSENVTGNNEQYPEDEGDGSLVISESQDLDNIQGNERSEELIVYEIEGQALPNQFCLNEDGQIVQINGENVTQVQSITKS